jgi:predicted ATPase/class 3 adenylate cyclase/Tfp pilus assembly protein PilF
MNDHALVFTDVVGSTALVERLGDPDAARLWAEHDRRARELLARHRGREIDRADGVFALFADPADAARYALAYHDALQPLALRARCSVHVGAVTLRDNRPEDVARGAKPIEVDGRAKPLGARVMSLAGGGQTLLTAAARQALRDTLPPGCVVKSHGHYRLKGIDTPIEVFELGLGERAAFDPPADAEKAYRVVRQGDLWIPLREVRHNLPAERDEFVDRRTEVRHLSERLDAGARLITVLGPGGTGKTRFVSRHGWSRLGDWPGGIYFCDLSESRSREGIVSAVAVALDAPLSAKDPTQQIGHAIAGRGRCLIILDNFEQVVQHAGDTLGPWLDRATEAAFVVTSRERLNLRGEEVLALEPLPVGEDAIELFVHRARSHSPGFVLHDSDRPTIERIVELLDGLPLAIELAAARVRLLAPAQLLERLHARFQLLSGARSHAARQATLRATIDWSWQLLTPWEQAALAQCSVFEGGFTLEAAEATLDLAAWPDAPPVIDVVQALIDKSLLRRGSRVKHGPRDEPVFGAYISIREFAAEQLDALGATARAAVELRHARFYAAFGSDAAIDALYLHGGTERRLALARDLDNLVIACERALARNDATHAMPLYRTIAEVVQRQGPFALSDRLGARVLAQPSLTPPQRAAALFQRGFALLRMGRLDDARVLLNQGLALARECGSSYIEGRVLSALSWLAEVQGQTERAVHLAEAVLAVHRSGGHRRTEGSAMTSMAYFEHQLGHVAQSKSLYEAALALHRELGNRYDECGTLWRYGVMNAEQGRLPEAQALFEQALQIATELQDRVIEGEVLTNLAVLHNELQLPEQATLYYRRALTLHREVGNRRWEACVLGELAKLDAAQGHIEEALRTTEQALSIAREIGDRQVEGAELSNLGEMLARVGRIDDARRALRDSAAVLRPIGARIYLGEALCARAELEHRCGDRAAAAAAYTEAQTVASAMHLEPASDLQRRIDAIGRLLDGPDAPA